MKPPIANAMNLARAGDTVIADAASSFSRTPTIMRPMPVRLMCPTSTSTSTSTIQHEVVVGAVAVGELERPDVGAWDLARSELPAVKNGRSKRYACAAIANASVLIASSRPADAQRADADDDRDQAREAAPSSIAHGNEMPASPPSRMRVVAPADVELHATDQRGGGERTEPGERHLPERELATPPGEHHHRDRAEREGDDRRPRLVPLRLVGQQREDHRGEQRQHGDELRQPFAPTRCCGAARGRPRCGERTGSSRRPSPSRCGSPAPPARARRGRARTARVRSRPCS